MVRQRLCPGEACDHFDSAFTGPAGALPSVPVIGRGRGRSSRREVQRHRADLSARVEAHVAEPAIGGEPIGGQPQQGRPGR